MIDIDDQITYDAALEALRAAVAEKGANYLYVAPDPEKPKHCLYATEVDGELKPSCIVGHALYRLGVPLESLLPYAAHDVDMLIEALDLDIADDATRALSQAQMVQDGAVDMDPGETGHSWGHALEAAEAV